MTSSPRFGELRSLVHAEPSSESWSVLSAILEDWPDESIEVCTAYCRKFLETWSIPRMAPSTWLWRLARGEEEPRLLLCDTIFIDDQRADELLVGLLHDGAHLRPLCFSLLVEVEREAFGMLMASPLLSNVRELYLAGLNSDDVAVLARSPFLSRVQSLDLEDSHVSAEALRDLVDGPCLPNLTRLDLFDCGLTGDVVAALARSPGSAKLERLNLGGDNPIGPQGAQALAESPYLAGLDVLCVNPKYDGGVGQNGLRILAASPYLCDRIRQSFEAHVLTESP